MPQQQTRRGFLADVGRGMLVASVGATVAQDLGVADLRGAESPGELAFGPLEPLVDFFHSTPAEQMLPEVVRRLHAGTELKELVAAAALANARAFGGEDYVGFHTLMALSPALTVAKHLRTNAAALPVLKVLYRNSNRMQELGGAEHHTLRPLDGTALAPPPPAPGELNRLVHGADLAGAERRLVGLAQAVPEAAFDEMLSVVEEAPEVHRVVLIHRAWEMLPLVGREHAAAMLRQSLHYCVKNEKYAADYFGQVRSLLPKLFDQHRLEGRPIGTRVGDDAWLESMVQMLWASTAEQAADAVAAALAEGFAPAALAEAVSLAANQLVLRDAGRAGNQIQPHKPAGSVHGDSIGVHACDSANAWRSLAAHGHPRHAFAATILAGYQVALDRTNRGGHFQTWLPRPTAATLAGVTETSKCRLLGMLNAAIRANDQDAACAVTHRYLELRHSPSNLWISFAAYATSEDGALHAEKFFRTCRDEYDLTRPAFRNRQLVALARVTASQFGTPAPGYETARKLLVS